MPYTRSPNLRFLRQQLKITDERSSAYRNMDDAEYVLRFMALSEGDFKGSLIRAMDEFMDSHRDAPQAFIQAKIDRFSSAAAYCERIWGELAFKRPSKDGWRDQLLAGMFDAQMLAVDQVDYEDLDIVADNYEKAIEGTRALFEDATFEEAVRTGTNTPTRIQYRVSKIRDLLTGIADESRAR